MVEISPTSSWPFTKGGESRVNWMFEGGGKLSLATQKLEVVVIGDIVMCMYK
jgi:hypothetical protein